MRLSALAVALVFASTMGCAELIEDTADPQTAETAFGEFELAKAASPQGQARRANPQDGFPGQGQGNGGAFPGQGNSDPFPDALCSAIDPDDPFFFWYEFGYAPNSGSAPSEQACDTDADCFLAGCSEQTCTADPTAISICAYMPAPDAGCLCVSGECIWATACAE